MAKRYPRHSVTGSPNTTVNEAGVFHRDKQLALIEQKLERANGTSVVLYLLRLLDYNGPVPRLGNTLLYPADDLATFAFYGSPQTADGKRIPWRFAYTIHADGNPDNRAIENISWGGSEAYQDAEAEHLFRTSRYMPQKLGRKISHPQRPGSPVGERLTPEYWGFTPNTDDRNP